MRADERASGQAPAAPPFMHHVKSSPPLSLLRIYVERLEAGGLRVALAGSGLLAALGFGDTIRDWDLTTDAPYERAVEALAGEAFVSHGSDDLHADRKLALSGGAVELIVRFAFHARGGVIRIPTIVSARMEGIPIGSPECWAIAYHLLGRERKSEALFAHLARHGAHRETVARLLEEPLPPSLAARLEALPTSRRT